MQKSFTPGLLLWALGFVYVYYRIRQTRIHIEQKIDSLRKSIDFSFNDLKISFDDLKISFDELKISLDLLKNDLQNLEDNRTGRNRHYVR